MQNRDEPRLRYSQKGSGALVVLDRVSDWKISLSWGGFEAESAISGAAVLTRNTALCAALQDFAMATKLLRQVADGPLPQEFMSTDPEVIKLLEDRPDGVTEEQWTVVKPRVETLDEKRRRLKMQVDGAREAILAQAKILAFGFDGEAETPQAWCSACLGLAEQRTMRVPATWMGAFECQNCGVITTRCTVPRCDNHAIRGAGPTGVRGVRLPICAEHTHEIPSFETSGTKVDDPEHWRDLFEHRRINVVHLAGRVGAVAAVASMALPFAYVAAPAIGGALGGLGAAGGFSGAAATSHGLALLGGGTIASGGLGMAGGQLVVTMAGGGLGGMAGMRIGSAYLAEDGDFDVECIRDGDGPAVLFASGFLTKEDDTVEGWLRLINTEYPNNPVYRVRWGTSELAELSTLFLGGGAKHVMAGGLKVLARKGLRAAAHAIAPLQLVGAFADVVSNPWHKAVNRADHAGRLLATILLRTEHDQGFVLVGHSLGGALMASTIQALGGTGGPSPVHAAHLLGAAFPSGRPVHDLAAGVDGPVSNYFSRKDSVLRAIYPAASFGVKAAGSVGLDSVLPHVRNVDVTKLVPGHSNYLKRVTLLAD